MKHQQLSVPQDHVHKLLAAASPDAALLYLYLHSGNAPEDAERELAMPQSRQAIALATLRQLGLWSREEHTFRQSGQRPAYSEQDVLQAMHTDGLFRSLYGEVQRVLGRNLNTEELKILLGFVNYLGLPEDVISVLVHYCKDRARQRGSLRNPSLRSIEKEAYAWAEQGIDTVEAAAAYIQQQNLRSSRLGRLMQLLQIRGRNLTAAEERYAGSWLDMGFDEEALSMAYERTCLNTGGLNWAYMNKILTRWQQAGLLTGEQVRSGERKPESKTTNKSGFRSGPRPLDEDERAAIDRIMQEG